MQDGNHISDVLVLKVFQKQARPRKIVRYQYRSYIIEITRALGERYKSQEDLTKALTKRFRKC